MPPALHAKTVPSRRQAALLRMPDLCPCRTRPVPGASTGHNRYGTSGGAAAGFLCWSCADDGGTSRICRQNGERGIRWAASLPLSSIEIHSVPESATYNRHFQSGKALSASPGRRGRSVSRSRAWTICPAQPSVGDSRSRDLRPSTPQQLEICASHTHGKPGPLLPPAYHPQFRRSDLPFAGPLFPDPSIPPPFSAAPAAQRKKPFRMSGPCPRQAVPPTSLPGMVLYGTGNASDRRFGVFLSAL